MVASMRSSEMAGMPKKVAERLATGLRKFQPILASSKSRDVNEADTVTLVKDILAELFGYDKYSEVTSECSIRGTWCDLGIKLEDGKFLFLIEVKAIGLELKDHHVKQAVDYSANQGTEWVLLTNGEVWRVYRVTFAKPISNELVLELNLSSLTAKRQADLELLFHLTREGWAKSAIDAFHQQRQALSRFTVAAVVLSDSVVDVVRRELRRLSPEVRISQDEVRTVLLHEVLKREVAEGEQAEQAARRLSRAASRALREKTERTDRMVATASPPDAEITDAQ
jgi:predicted type IV restriction endonuclease